MPSTNYIELPQCPFCGNSSNTIYIDRDKIKVVIECIECKASVQGNRLRQAVEGWKRRLGVKAYNTTIHLTEELVEADKRLRKDCRTCIKAIRSTIPNLGTKIECNHKSKGTPIVSWNHAPFISLKNVLYLNEEGRPFPLDNCPVWEEMCTDE